MGNMEKAELKEFLKQHLMLRKEPHPDCYGGSIEVQLVFVDGTSEEVISSIIIYEADVDY